MKERAFRAKAHEVRAILDGRMTQFRRVVEPSIVKDIEFMGGSNDDPPEFEFVGLMYGIWHTESGREKPPEWLIYCTEYPEDGCVPIGQVYGTVGDRLWVREACRAEELQYAGYEDGVRYLADDAWLPIENTAQAADDWVALNCYRGKRGATVPPIHMPRWASRILLEIVSVRVERLQDISEADAIAEGIRQYPEMNGMWSGDGDTFTAKACGPVTSYERLWDSINGPAAWDKNPWVWVIEFKRVQA